MTPDEAEESVAVLLDRAANLLEQGHWCRHGMVRVLPSGERAYCAVGAIREVAKGDSHWAESIVALKREVGCRLGIPAWNDRQRDKRVVIRAMRRTARKLRGAKR